jgi:spore maturation protein CgeB
VWALKSAEIGLGFVSEWNGNETAGRSFEIPACGTFLLAMRTPEHEKLYREGEEAEFFSSPEELINKALHYINNTALHQQVAVAGQNKCHGSGYTWQSLMQRDWAKLPQHLESNRLERR